jgi:5-methylcytosine-specific restriction protein A
MNLTKDQFIDALKTNGILLDKSIELLNIMFYSPNCQINGNEIARIMGYSDFPRVNALVGKLGKRIAQHFSINLEREDNSPGWWRIISDGEYVDNKFNWKLKPELIEALIDLRLLEENNPKIYPEVVIKKFEYCEGSVKKAEINVYERNYLARNECIKYYKPICSVCYFNFEDKYGKLGKDFIHVHHIKDIAYIGAEYKVNPIEDLRPVCPNCHAMLHQTTPAMSIEKLREIVRENA